MNEIKKGDREEKTPEDQFHINHPQGYGKWSKRGNY